MLDRGGPIEEAISNATAALSGLSACAGIVLVPKEEPVLRQLAFVPLSPRQAVAVVVGSDGSVENRVVDLPPGVTASTLAEVGNYVSARLSGLTLSEAQARLTGEIRDGRAALDRTARALVERGLAIWSEDGSRRPVMIVRGQANLIDEQRRGRSGAGPAIARGAGRQGGDRPVARSGPRRRGDEDFHRIGERPVRVVGFVGDRRALSRP